MGISTVNDSLRGGFSGENPLRAREVAEDAYQRILEAKALQDEYLAYQRGENESRYNAARSGVVEPVEYRSR